MLSRELKMQVIRRLKNCLTLAKQYFQQDFPFPEINYQIRGLKAGVAYLQKNEIRFNPTLLSENPQEFIRQVVPHELAHLLVFQLFGRVKPHGKEWQGIMQQVFGLEADVCHQFDTQSVQGKTFAYQCQCQTHHLTLRRHNKILRKQMNYFCKKCHQPLKPID